MSKLQFESLRHEISHLVHGSRDPLSGRQLLPMCALGDEKPIADALFNMCKDGQLTRHPAPEGSGKGCKWVYGPDKVKLGAAAPSGDSVNDEQNNPPGRKSAPREPVVKPRGPYKKRGVKRETAPNGARKKGAQRRDSSPAAAARWALTSDGAFILMGSATEIPAPAARALIEFVRRLDAGAA